MPQIGVLRYLPRPAPQWQYPSTTPTPGGPAEAMIAPFPGCLDPAAGTHPRQGEAGRVGQGWAGARPVLWNPHKRPGPGTMGG